MEWIKRRKCGQIWNTISINTVQVNYALQEVACPILFFREWQLGEHKKKIRFQGSSDMCMVDRHDFLPSILPIWKRTWIIMTTQNTSIGNQTTLTLSYETKKTIINTSHVPHTVSFRESDKYINRLLKSLSFCQWMNSACPSQWLHSPGWHFQRNLT